jgi:hypothetical protein
MERRFDGLDQDARVARAFGKGLDLIWSLTPAGSWQCESPSGKTYTVSAEHCDCADYQNRCSKVGARCYHQVALAHKLLAEGKALLTPRSAPEGRWPDTFSPFVCSWCHEPLRQSEARINESTGEVICKLCEPVSVDCEEMTPEEIRETFRELQEEAEAPYLPPLSDEEQASYLRIFA